MLLDIINDDDKDHALEMQHIDISVSSDKHMSLHRELNDQLSKANKFCEHLKYVYFETNLYTIKSSKGHKQDAHASARTKKTF
jgi:hypothetical protein